MPPPAAARPARRLVRVRPPPAGLRAGFSAVAARLRARVIEGDAGGRIAAQQRGDLVVRTSLQEDFQQRGHGARVIEGDAGGKIAAQQRGDLVLRTCLPQHAEQDDNMWVADGAWAAARSARTVACWPAPASSKLSSSQAAARGSSRETRAAGSRSSSAMIWSRARRPQTVQQRSHGARIIEGEARDSAIGQRGYLVPAPASHRLCSSLATPIVSSRGTCAMARSASAVACFSAPTPGRYSSR